MSAIDDCLNTANLQQNLALGLKTPSGSFANRRLRAEFPRSVQYELGNILIEIIAIKRFYSAMSDGCPADSGGRLETRDQLRASSQTAAPRLPQDEENFVMLSTVYLIVRSAQRTRLEARTMVSSHTFRGVRRSVLSPL